MHFVEKEPIQKRKDFTDKLKSKKIIIDKNSCSVLLENLISSKFKISNRPTLRPTDKPTHRSSLPELKKGAFEAVFLLSRKLGNNKDCSMTC